MCAFLVLRASGLQRVCTGETLTIWSMTALCLPFALAMENSSRLRKSSLFPACGADEDDAAWQGKLQAADWPW